MFYINLHNFYGAHQVFCAVAEEKFCVDIDNSAVSYYFGNILFYFGYTSACNLVSVFVRVIAVKVNVCVCKDEVKLNYFHSILNQREPYTDYAENKEKHTKGI